MAVVLSGCQHSPAAGSITLLADPEAGDFVVIHDEFGLTATGIAALAQLPVMAFDFVMVGDELLPVQRERMATPHPVWEYSVAPGRTWQDSKTGNRRATLPFSLYERNANCVHHGEMSWAFDGADTVRHALYTITGETCAYFQFDSRGVFEVHHQRSRPANAAVSAQRYAQALSHRLPTRPIATLDEHLPGAQHRRFGSTDEVDPADMTVYGFVVDGLHFRGGCELRDGPLDHCEALSLPSYSLAKSLFAALAVMRAEKLHPGIAQVRIGAVVEACRDVAAWQDVTIEHALDMATGHYSRAAWMADENAAVLDDFFLAKDHATKMAAACQAHPAKSPPGTLWVYHTSDTYLAGVARRAALTARGGRDVDRYEALLWEPVFSRQGLSPIARSIRRTHDSVAQPFFGWGMYFQPDDVAKLANFLGPQRGRIDGEIVFDEGMFEAAMQRDPVDRGLPADMEGMRYKSGFRALDVAPWLGCSDAAWVIVLSGYGGVLMALFPNDTAYYYFSDGGTHRWMTAARESHRLRPFCAEMTGANS
ncbi:MAG: serine hydrolase [Gammaproteobacteria bacterium]|nr:serine hydrolase [Gammaproteobacteria bacterium]